MTYRVFISSVYYYFNSRQFFGRDCVIPRETKQPSDRADVSVHNHLNAMQEFHPLYWIYNAFSILLSADGVGQLDVPAALIPEKGPTVLIE